MSGVNVLIRGYEANNIIMGRTAMLKSFDSDDLETSIEVEKIRESPIKKIKL